MCLRICPHEVFDRSEKAVILANPASCMECGGCALNCPAGALDVDSGTGGAIPVIMALLGRDEDDYRHERIEQGRSASQDGR